MKRGKSMKTIEQLELNNIVLIDRYLNDQLTEMEMRRFERRLEIDNDLRLDFKMVLESYRKDYAKLRRLKKHQINLDEFNADVAFLKRKVSLGKRIVSFGLMAVLFVISLVVICSVVLALFTSQT